MSNSEISGGDEKACNDDSADRVNKIPIDDDPRDSLIRAIRNGDSEGAKALLKTRSLSYWEEWSNGRNVLHDVIEKHDVINDVKLLSISDDTEASKPLGVVVRNHDRDKVAALLKENNESDHYCQVSVENNCASFEDASSSQSVDTLVKLLIRRCANRNNTPTENARFWRRLCEMAKKNAVLEDNAFSLPLTKDQKVYSMKKINSKSVLEVAMNHDCLSTIELVLNYRLKETNEQTLNHLSSSIIGTSYNDEYHIIEALLFYGFTFYRTDARNSALLHAAVKDNCKKILETLFKLGGDVNERDNTNSRMTLLHTASLYCCFEMTMLLLSHGGNPNFEDDLSQVPINYATYNGDSDIIKLLLIGGAKINVSKEVLNHTVKTERIEIVEFILDKAPDLLNATDIEGHTVLHHTVLDGSCDPSSRIGVVDMLVTRGASITATNYRYTTVLHLAAEGGYTKVVEFLVEKGADVNARELQISTPLHRAAVNNNPAIVEILLDNGARVNDIKDDGSTALHIASNYGCDDVVKLLIERDADPDAEDKNKMTPLHLAAIKGYSAIVITLLTLGASIDVQDINGRTALHHAVNFNHAIVVHVLLNNGADINIITHDRMTALEIACSQPRPFDWNSASEAARILEKHIHAIMAINYYVSPQNVKLVKPRSSCHLYWIRWQKQIDKMKIETIGNSNVSFYNVLMADRNQLVLYARHDDIIHALEPGNWDGKFPNYSRMILRRLKQGQRRKHLINASSIAFNYISGYNIPDLASIQILSHLSDKDLQNVIKAGRRNDESNP